MRRSLKIGVISVFLTACLIRSASALVIDDFSVGPINLVRGATSIEETQTGLDAAHVVGGGRHILLGQFASAGQSLAVDTSAQTMTFSAGPNFGYCSVDYGSQVSPLNLDLTVDGSTKFAFTFAGANASTRFPTFLVYNTAVPQTGFPLTLTRLPIAPDGTLRTVADFSQLSAAGFNPHSIGRISWIAGRYPPGESFTLKSIATVPEPPTVWLLAAFLIALAIHRFTAVSRLPSPLVK